MTTRERVHAAIQRSAAAGACNLPGCAFPSWPHEFCTMPCDELVAEFERDLGAAETTVGKPATTQVERRRPEPGLGAHTPAAPDSHSTPQRTAGAVDAPATAGPTAAAESQRASVGLDPEGSAAAPVVCERCRLRRSICLCHEEITDGGGA